MGKKVKGNKYLILVPNNKSKKNNKIVVLTTQLAKVRP